MIPSHRSNGLTLISRLLSILHTSPTLVYIRRTVCTFRSTLWRSWHFSRYVWGATWREENTVSSASSAAQQYYSTVLYIHPPLIKRAKRWILHLDANCPSKLTLGPLLDIYLYTRVRTFSFLLLFVQECWRDMSVYMVIRLPSLYSEEFEPDDRSSRSECCYPYYCNTIQFSGP